MSAVATTEQLARVLVIDDEPQILRALATNLRVRGYEVVTAETGEEGLRAAATERPDIVILDLGLPGMDGIEVLRGLRGWTSIPVLVLSVRDREHDKVEALDVGADDFVTKPFGVEELLARVRAALRRAAPTEETIVIDTPHFQVDLAHRRVMKGEVEQRLTPTEWHLLEMLARSEGKLVTQRALLREVWGPQYEVETNYLRVYIARLRAKLEPVPSEPRYLLTEPGVGYRFCANR